MSLNRANMLVDTNSPKLARADINDMFADLGYSTSGNVSQITTTGEANKLFKFSAIANTILHFLRIRKSSTTALDVQNDSSTSVFNVDTTNEVITGTSITTTGEANKLIKTTSLGSVYLGLTADDSSSARLQVNGHLSLSSTINGIGSTARNKFFHLTSTAGNYRQGAEIASVSTGTYTFGSGATYNADLVFSTMYQNSLNEVFRLKSDKTVQLSGLAGTGSRMVVADASGNLSTNPYMTEIRQQKIVRATIIQDGLTGYCDIPLFDNVLDSTKVVAIATYINLTDSDTPYTPLMITACVINPSTVRFRISSFIVGQMSCMVTEYK